MFGKSLARGGMRFRMIEIGPDSARRQLNVIRQSASTAPAWPHRRARVGWRR
jgi:hypothetical protein